MNAKTVARFKKIFEEERNKILHVGKLTRDEISVVDEDKPDEVDQATTDVEQSMQMRLRNREVGYLKKLEEALMRIEEGTFGECENCGEDVEIRRLEARPTATLCIACKEEEERREGFGALARRGATTPTAHIPAQ